GGLSLHGFRSARGPVGLACHGRSPSGRPVGGLALHPPPLGGRRSCELRCVPPSSAFGGLSLHGFRSARGPVGLVCHGRSPCARPVGGLGLQPPPLGGR